MPQPGIKHIAYNNGVIRDVNQKIVGFFDKEENTLILDVELHVYHVVDLDHAMDIVGDYFA